MPAVWMSDRLIYLFLHGVFITIGTGYGLHLVRKEVRRCELRTSLFIDLCFVVLIAAAVGSRLPYLVLNIRLLLADPLDSVRIWHGGVEFYGGFLAAFICGVLFIRRKKMPVWPTADIFAPAVAMGVFWGKLGYLGLGYAQRQELYRMYLLSPARFEWLNPFVVQVLLAILNLLMYFILVAVRPKSSYAGRLFWLYLLMSSSSISIVVVMWNIGQINWSEIWMLPKLIVGCVLTFISATMLIVLKYRKNTAPDNPRADAASVSGIPESFECDGGLSVQIK